MPKSSTKNNGLIKHTKRLGTTDFEYFPSSPTKLSGLTHLHTLKEFLKWPCNLRILKEFLKNEDLGIDDSTNGDAIKHRRKGFSMQTFTSEKSSSLVKC